MLMKRYFTWQCRGVIRQQRLGSAKVRPVLPLLHTGAQLSFTQHGLFTFLSHPQERCNACSSTSLQPQSLAPMNCRAWFFKSRDSNPSQLNKTSSENSGVGGYLTGESNYNWHLDSRQTAATWHELQYTKRSALAGESNCAEMVFTREKQTKGSYRALLTVPDRPSVWRADLY